MLTKHDDARTTSTQSGQDTVADLEALAAELAERGLKAELHAPDGKLPYLQVHNPDVTAFRETVYAQAGAYWYSWSERIAGCGQPDAAAARLARVLSTTNSGQ